MKKWMNEMRYKLLVKGLLLKEDFRERSKRLKEFNEDNRGVAVIEIILILVVVMALGVVFREKIKDLFDKIFKKINDTGGDIMKSYQ